MRDNAILIYWVIMIIIQIVPAAMMGLDGYSYWQYAMLIGSVYFLYARFVKKPSEIYETLLAAILGLNFLIAGAMGIIGGNILIGALSLVGAFLSFTAVYFIHKEHPEP